MYIPSIYTFAWQLLNKFWLRNNIFLSIFALFLYISTCQIFLGIGQFQMKMTSFKIFLFFLPDGRIRMEDRTQLDLRKYLVRLTPVNWGVDPPGLRGRVGVGVAMTVGGRRRPRRPRPGWRRPAEVMRRTTSASWETLGFPFRDLADWELWRCCCHQMASIKIVSDQPLQIIK